MALQEDWNKTIKKLGTAGSLVIWPIRLSERARHACVLALSNVHTVAITGIPRLEVKAVAVDLVNGAIKHTFLDMLQL